MHGGIPQGERRRRRQGRALGAPEGTSWHRTTRTPPSTRSSPTVANSWRRRPSRPTAAGAVPGSGTVVGPADPVASAVAVSEVRATIDPVPRWDDAPIVGRADELARLMAHVQRAVEGRSSSVLLAGDAGVGKSRLLDELVARATERGVRVLVGHCVDLGDVGLPYLPFVDLLRPVAGEPELAPISTANPVLAGLLAGRVTGVPPVPSPSDGRELSRPLPHRAAPQPA